jgi:hypothetical protein
MLQFPLPIFSYSTPGNSFVSHLPKASCFSHNYWPVLRALHVTGMCHVEAFVFCVLCGLVVRVPAYTPMGRGFDSRRNQIFWEAVGLERVPLSLVMIIEELFQGNSGSGLENRYYRPCIVFFPPIVPILKGMWQMVLSLYGHHVRHLYCLDVYFIHRRLSVSQRCLLECYVVCVQTCPFLRFKLRQNVPPKRR